MNIYLDQVKVGDVYNFSAPPNTIGRGPEGCENCNRQILEGTLVTGQVPITRAIWLASNVDELNEDEVQQYLTAHLHWDVILVSTSILIHHHTNHSNYHDPQQDGLQVPEADYHFLKGFCR